VYKSNKTTDSIWCLTVIKAGNTQFELLNDSDGTGRRWNEQSTNPLYPICCPHMRMFIDFIPNLTTPTHKNEAQKQVSFIDPMIV
jgi:hypothetical protein